MRCFCVVGLLSFVLTGINASSTLAAEPIRLRVMSYNIHHAEGVDGKLDVARIARVISDEKPDLVSLQEVDKKVKRTGGVDQATELGKLTGLHVVFGGNIRLQGGEYGNAVLSRLPIHASENHRLPNVAQGEQRGLLVTQLQLADNAGIVLFGATHFDHREDDAERFQSAAAVEKLLGRHTAARTAKLILLAGDLNDGPDSRTLRSLREQWSSVNERPLATIPVDHPLRQIDFILFRPQGRARVMNVRVLGEAVASDHRAIVADLEL
jgi:endonuclease/exonuclease/phosphatase family metal-dependent hydrolase